MPGFDGTGPRGEGPLTGGGRGYCVEEVFARGVPKRDGSGRGRRANRGRGGCRVTRGRGRGRR